MASLFVTGLGRRVEREVSSLEKLHFYEVKLKISFENVNFYEVKLKVSFENFHFYEVKLKVNVEKVNFYEVKLFFSDVTEGFWGRGGGREERRRR